MKPSLLNGSNLAYVGDAYYELMVRRHLLEKGITRNKELRKISIDYVSASAHQKIYSQIGENFTEEEMQIFLRGRNNAPHGYRKNIDKNAYQISTGLEAVIGYLYLTESFSRLDTIIKMIFEEVEKN